MAEFLFGTLALLGLLAAKRPEVFVRYFLAEQQRERLAGQMSAVSWTGWMIFGCSALTVIAMLISRLPG
jgi:hypothetical protein